MRKVKIFSDSGPRVVQQAINEWLADHESVVVYDMLQSESYLNEDSDGCGLWSLTVTIFYCEEER